MQTKEIETLNFMVEFQDARIAKLVDDNKRLTVELEAEKARVKAMQDHVNEIDDFEIAVLDAKDKRVIN
jgi:uncharacterized coiled-coil protein SlyX